MLIKRRPSWALSESEVTPESVYLNRRKFMAGTMASAAALTMPALLKAEEGGIPGDALQYKAMPAFSTDEKKAPYPAITSYNNFYEFGTDKGDPA